MKNYRMFAVIAVLVLASLVCQALSGIGGKSQPPSGSPGSNDSPTQDSGPASNGTGNGDSSDSGFVMTADAYNVTNIGDGSLLYYTKLSLEDVMKFYRDEYTAKGYKERELLTVVSDGTFSMVFDGDPSGKAIVIQSVDLGDGSRTVAIRFEDV